MPSLTRAPSRLNMLLLPGTFGRHRAMFEVIALATAVLVGIIATLPSTEEKAAALVAQKHFAQAITLLEAKEHQTLLNDHEAFSLIALYRQDGEEAKAIELLETTAARETSASWALGALAEIYRADGRSEDEARILRQSFRLKPTFQARDRLVELFQFDHDLVGEREILIAARGAGLGQPADEARLAQIEVDLRSAPTLAPTNSVRSFIPNFVTPQKASKPEATLAFKETSL